ncbi:MAG: hypothetical protein HUK07_04990, partial [Bacteroidaceae bacterium]|nr:hypothetical protein [Bacteroidaceae bacterium]
MNKRFTSIVCGLILLLLTANVPAVLASDFGFCTSSVDRNNIFRVGSTEKQGMAMKFSAEKLAALKGSTISSISAAFGSKRMTGGTVNLFIATNPNETP